MVLDPFCGSGTTLVAARLLGRRALGIDNSSEAVALTRERLRRPVRTTSDLVRKGRQAYAQSDQDALAYLHGLDVVPVQRNRGIDAILVGKPGRHPILVRVQRAAETLRQAADSLRKAGKKKQPATLVLLATGPVLDAPAAAIPQGILVVPSVASNLRKRLGLLD
jgi:site-specific DNA-methyltransferase (adenine-specific)